MSDWGSWTNCTKSCGGGEKKRTRSINVQPANGGVQCQSLEETQLCNPQACPSNKGMLMQDTGRANHAHCIQTRSRNDDYWGYPADGWNLVMWWHDPGNQCFNTTTDDRRFRVNFTEDGRIQSLLEPTLYLVPESATVDSTLKWSTNGQAKWEYTSDNKVKLQNSNLCLGHINVHNKAWVHLRPCSSASTITLTS
jgi:hypothetical protein